MHKFNLRLIGIALCLAAFFFSGELLAAKVAFLGRPLTSAELTSEEKNAFSWLQNNYDALYLSFEEIKANQNSLSSIDVVWWHMDSSLDLPAIAKNDTVVNALKAFVSGGKGLFLSGFATQYVIDLGLETTKPQEIHSGLTTSGNWGLYAKVKDHPVFQGLTQPFATLSAGAGTMNSICWWNIPSTFHGTWLADVEWQSGILVACGEYKAGTGKVVFTGAGAFDWNVESGINSNRLNLEKFTKNIITYITPAETFDVAFLGAPQTSESLSGEEKAAFDFAKANYKCSYKSFEVIKSDPSSLDSFKVLWWHFNERTSLPLAAEDNGVLLGIKNFVAKGKGLLLTGAAAQYVYNLGYETHPPQVISITDTVSTISGFYQKAYKHPVFDKFINPFITLSANLNIKSVKCWWTDPENINGKWVADTEFKKNAAAITEYGQSSGKVLAIGAPGFTWQTLNGINQYKANLEQFTKNIFNYLKDPKVFLESGLVVNFSFPEGKGSQTIDSVSRSNFQIQNNFNKPEWVSGVKNKALRLDGYSTWVRGSINKQYSPSDAISVTAWLALEAYPVSDAAIVNQNDVNSGFFFGVDNLGKWYFKVSLGGMWYTCFAKDKLPKNQWAHLAATFSTADGIKLYLNGQMQSSLSTPFQSITPAYDTELQIGKSIQTKFLGNLFPTGVLNGIIDEVKVYNRALTQPEVTKDFNQVQISEAPDFSIPSGRFANDPFRPKYHPIPSANWTNEPHGLMYINGKYHIFYQKNPNGPYWEQIHWGHMASDDMIRWEELPIALAPEEGIDQRGIWSGCSLVDNGRANLIYTAVDGAKARMSLAQNIDDKMIEWKKYGGNPVVSGAPSEYNHMDFRDPFMWKEPSAYYMIVGSGINNVGGTVFLYKSQDLLSWNFLKPLYTGERNTSGIFWEMPTFVKFGEKYVLLVNKVPSDGQPANALYWVGTFNNEVFTPDFQIPKQLEIFNHFLSPSVTKDAKGRTVAIGIIPDLISGERQLAQGWAHLFSMPRLWSLENNRLVQKPLPEFETLRKSHRHYENLKVIPGKSDILTGIQGDNLEIVLELDLKKSTLAGLVIAKSPDGREKTLIYYDAGTKKLKMDLTNSSLGQGVQKGMHTGDVEIGQDNTLKLHLFIDKSVIEGFTGEGGAFGKRIFPTLAESKGIDLFSTGDTAIVKSIDIYELNDALSPVHESNSGMPESMGLMQNYPNPFNPSTKIKFLLNDAQSVSLVIYDTLGRAIKTIYSNAAVKAGEHLVNWDGRNDYGTDVSSGIYFCSLKTNSYSKTIKMILLR